MVVLIDTESGVAVHGPVPNQYKRDLAGQATPKQILADSCSCHGAAQADQGHA